MKNALKLVWIAALTLAAVPVLAAGPDTKIAVTGEEVAALYSGKTLFWKAKTGTSGGYWAPDGKFEAVWREAVGVGKWYTTDKGALCYDARFRRKASDQVTAIKQCWDHVKDSTGAWWKQDPDTRKWYDAAEELSERLKDGNQISAIVAKRRKKTGL